MSGQTRIPAWRSSSHLGWSHRTSCNRFHLGKETCHPRSLIRPMLEDRGEKPIGFKVFIRWKTTDKYQTIFILLLAGLRAAIVVRTPLIVLILISSRFLPCSQWDHLNPNNFLPCPFTPEPTARLPICSRPWQQCNSNNRVKTFTWGNSPATFHKASPKPLDHYHRDGSRQKRHRE